MAPLSLASHTTYKHARPPASAAAIPVLRERDRRPGTRTPERQADMTGRARQRTAPAPAPAARRNADDFCRPPLVIRMTVRAGRAAHGSRGRPVRPPCDLHHCTARVVVRVSSGNRTTPGGRRPEAGPGLSTACPGDGQARRRQGREPFSPAAVATIAHAQTTAPVACLASARARAGPSALRGARASEGLNRPGAGARGKFSRGL